MFTRLAKQAAAPAQILKSAIHNNNNSIRNNHLVLRTNTAVVSFNSVRHQSSSSSSRDNDNSNNQDIEPMTSNEVPINASIELHRVDLAHGSFFAMHRPLLGITNGPMFTNNNGHMNEEEYEDPVDDLVNYFATLHPYNPPSPMIQSALVTPTATAWASMALTVPEADLAVEDFLNIIEDKQALWEQEDEKNKNLPSAIATTTLGNIEGSIPGGSVMNPSQNESNRMHMTSVLRKRKIKMRKHKYKKLRKRTRALRKKLGK